MNSRLVLFVLLAVLLGTPVQTAPTQTPSGSVPQVSSVLDEWARDWKARNPEALRAFYAQDAVFYPALDRCVMGRKAIGNYFKQFLEQLADSHSGEIVSQWAAEDSGNLAYANGAIQYLVKGKCRAADIGDGPCVVKGYYLMVLTRGSDSKWLIARQSLAQIGLGSTIFTKH